MNKKTILIVDDTETNIDILLDLLHAYDVVVATDGPTALEIVSEQHIDLILLDIMMPEMDGYEVCRQLKQNSTTSEIPIIFITAISSEESIEKAYDIGGNDYITKPFKPKELLARVNRELQLKSLITHLEFIASHDAMTGIYNRRKFFELGEDMFQTKHPDIHAVMLDIDKFKLINDTYGHPVGDQVIVAVSGVIGTFLKEGDIFGRLGGEEFAILSIDSTQELQERLEKIRAAVAAKNVFSDDAQQINFTISSGMTRWNESMETIDALLKLADDALYDAKQSGRNKVIFRL